MRRIHNKLVILTLFCQFLRLTAGTGVGLNPWSSHPGTQKLSHTEIVTHSHIFSFVTSPVPRSFPLQFWSLAYCPSRPPVLISGILPFPTSSYNLWHTPLPNLQFFTATDQKLKAGRPGNKLWSWTSFCLTIVYYILASPALLPHHYTLKSPKHGYLNTYSTVHKCMSLVGLMAGQSWQCLRNTR